MSRQMAAQYTQLQAVELMKRFLERLQARERTRPATSTIGDFIDSVQDPKEKQEFMVAAVIAEDLEKKGRKLQHIRLVVQYKLEPGEHGVHVRIEYDPVAISKDKGPIWRTEVGNG